MKKKLDGFTKAKLIYSGELIIIAIALIILAILEYSRIIKVSDMQTRIFTWVTFIGSFLIMGDFCWAILSKKRRQRISLIDKCLALPLAIFLFIIGLLTFIKNFDYGFNFHSYVIPSVFLYVGIMYIFEGVYHWFYPIPYLFEDDNKDDNDIDNSSNQEQDIDNH